MSNKLMKFVLICFLCIGIVVLIVWLIQYLKS
jgi:hypothetical protein